MSLVEWSGLLAFLCSTMLSVKTPLEQFPSYTASTQVHITPCNANINYFEWIFRFFICYARLICIQYARNSATSVCDRLVTVYESANFNLDFVALSSALMDNRSGACCARVSQPLCDRTRLRRLDTSPSLAKYLPQFPDAASKVRV